MSNTTTRLFSRMSCDADCSSPQASATAGMDEANSTLARGGRGASSKTPTCRTDGCRIELAAYGDTLPNLTGECSGGPARCGSQGRQGVAGAAGQARQSNGQQHH